MIKQPMKKIARITYSPKETGDFGAILVKDNLHHLKRGALVFAMQGELGAGKTEMTKGIAKTLGIKKNINSPTFIIEKKHRIHVPGIKGSTDEKGFLLHIDTWRLNDELELEKIGFWENLNTGNVFVIEWADKCKKVLKKASKKAKIIWISIKPGKGPNERKITVSD